MNVWSCEAPGWLGNTIGSSGLWWLTAQLAWNSWKPLGLGPFTLDGVTPVTGLGAITHPDPSVDALDPGTAVGDASVVELTAAACAAAPVPNTLNSHRE